MIINQKQSVIWQRRWLNFWYPVMYVIGRICGFSRAELELKYIDKSNRLNKSQGYRISADKILLLVPHCLQKDACMHKVTRHIDNCHQCGGCRIGDLVGLQKKYGCGLEAVTGGTLARQVIKKRNPQAIVAIACERDLCSGIIDVLPIPVIGTLNERPYGPCFNTDVDIDKVEDALKFFMGERYV